jgi:hypothetical protein
VTPNAAKDKGGDYKRTADLTSDQVKQNASGFLGTAQDKTNEIAGAVEEKSEQAKDSATCTWNSTKDKTSNTAATAQDPVDSTLKSAKEQTDSATGVASTRSKGGGTAASGHHLFPLRFCIISTSVFESAGICVLFGQDVRRHQSNC